MSQSRLKEFQQRTSTIQQMINELHFDIEKVNQEIPIVAPAFSWKVMPGSSLSVNGNRISKTDILERYEFARLEPPISGKTTIRLKINNHGSPGRNSDNKFIDIFYQKH